MGRKIQHNRFSCRIPQLFLDLRGVPVSRYAVSLYILVHLAEKIGHLRSAPCAGSTALSVNDQSIRIDQALLDQRISCQDRAGRIAARIRYQPGALHILTVDLAQSVDRLLYVLGRLVLDAVPFLIDRHILDSKVGAQIHHLRLRQDRLVYQGRTIPLRRRRKDHIRLPGQLFHIVVQTFLVHNLKHVPIHVSVFLIYITFRPIPHDLYLFMSQKKPYQLASRIACGSYDSCFYHLQHSFLLAALLSACKYSITPVSNL